MKELDSFTVERLEEIRNSFLDRIQETAPSIEEVFALIDIALAAKRAEPVGYLEQNHLDYLRSGSDADIWSEGGAGDIPIYLTPQLNSQVPLGGWIKCSDQMPTCSSEFLVYETMNNKVQHDYWVSDDDAALDRGFWNHYDTKVTHWMPLPAAPEKENG